MFSALSFIVKYKNLFLALVAVLPLLYLYFDYTNTKNYVQKITTENATLSTKLKQNEATLQNVITQQERLTNQFEVMSSSFNRIRNENIELSRRIRRSLSTTNTSNIIKTEETINTITKNMNRCFEILSGSNLTEEERNATSPEEFNSECPFLFPGGN
jgi:D-ribose pyranose/furanose isomerase RbsD